MKLVPGTVYLVGAGPGDPGLMTVRGRALLEAADVVVHDRLIGSEMLTLARPDAELIDVGKTPGDHRNSQEQIHKILVERARSGLSVVRLKGGDPFVFGRGFEELQACRAAGIPCIVVPGVSSAMAGPAAAGIPVTLRGVSRSFAVVTAGVAAGSQAVDFAAFNDVDTLIVLMGRARLAEVVDALLASGRDPSIPVACVEHATTPRQRVVRAPLSAIAEAADREGLCSPMITVIGAVAAVNVAPQSDHSGIAGKRVLVTRNDRGIDDTLDALNALGAVPILMPLIEIQYDFPGLSPLPPRLQYEWLVFTSVHGVYGFWRVLHREGRDTRALGGCKVAAIGSATARALRHQGVNPDLVAKEQTSGSLLRDLRQAGITPASRILHLRGDIAGSDIAQGLRGGGPHVDEMVVYSTADATPSKASMAELEKGVDAILFFSPSAVRRFTALRLRARSAIIACIGPTTAGAADEEGLPVHVVSPARSGEALVAGLAELLQLASFAC